LAGKPEPVFHVEAKKELESDRAKLLAINGLSEIMGGISGLEAFFDAKKRV